MGLLLEEVTGDVVAFFNLLPLWKFARAMRERLRTPAREATARRCVHG